MTGHLEKTKKNLIFFYFFNNIVFDYQGKAIS